MTPRRQTMPISIGEITIGGGSPISVQSMCSTHTEDVERTLSQIHALESAGCEIVRVSVPNIKSAEALEHILPQIHIPLIADIHFDHRMALEALKKGVHGLRLNPGNIRNKDQVRRIVAEAKAREVPIRIGVNGGSLSKPILKKYHLLNEDGSISHDSEATAQAMVESAWEHIHILEELHFYLIKLSLKSTDVPTTVLAYQEMGKACNYPFHLGITEAGTFESGSIKSAVGLGILLSQGIGDTIRVSLTDDPVKEVKVGYEILKALQLRQKGPVLISCPTCGRCQVDLIPLAQKVEAHLQTVQKPLKVAVMGCAVNGPGEARGADIGIAAGRGEGLIFRKGKILKKVPEGELLEEFLKEVDRSVQE